MQKGKLVSRNDGHEYQVSFDGRFARDLKQGPDGRHVPVRDRSQWTVVTREGSFIPDGEYDLFLESGITTHLENIGGEWSVLELTMPRV